MSKIMVVEDDASLREIYSIRIAAEGYEIVTAGDGEEALALAVREKPDLILSDVMMPKISGFDMLDILRSTPETKDIKVVMMTALSSDDQRQRGERLGADRYLVKSQVGIEDVVNTIHEILGDKAPAPEAAPAEAAQTPAANPAQPFVAPTAPYATAVNEATSIPNPVPENGSNEQPTQAQ
ncbi:response regulator [Candidatus Saccharibacteria bacterium]|nr:response regulator [Candidatus Saccharibacteria bacterium]